MSEIKQGRVKVILKPNSKQNKINRFDSEKDAYIIEVKAPAHDNKANAELLRFLSKTLKKKFRIVKGMKSREKILEIITPR